MGTSAAQRDAGGSSVLFPGHHLQMDISRDEQRVLHVLAQGGVIEALKDKRGRIDRLVFINRNGFMLPAIALLLFKKLKRRKSIASREGGPYRITRRGLELVRSEVDNR